MNNKHLGDFGSALGALVACYPVRRRGWNGKNQYVYLQQLASYVEPCFIIRTEDGTHQPGWLPSTSDLLADDWEFADEAAKFSIKE